MCMCFNQNLWPTVFSFVWLITFLYSLSVWFEEVWNTWNRGIKMMILELLCGWIHYISSYHTLLPEYSKTILIWLAHGQVINCQILQIVRQYLYWPEFLQVIFCYCLSCKTDQSSIWISLSVSAGSTLSSSEFAGVFGAEEVYGQDIPQWFMYRHSWRNFWICPSDLPSSFLKFFFFFLVVKSKTLVAGLFWSTGLSGFPKYHVWLKELCCNIKLCPNYGWYNGR